MIASRTRNVSCSSPTTFVTILLLANCMIILHRTAAKKETMETASFVFGGIEDRLNSANEKYAAGLRAGGAALHQAVELYDSLDNRTGWNHEAEKNNDIVLAKFVNGEKIFALSSELPMNVDELFKEVWTGVPQLASWNTNIAFSNVVETLTPHADILHYATSDLWIVKGRDFVVGRVFRKIEGSYIMAARSFELATIPETNAKVRGHLRLASARYSPHPTDPNVTLVDYLMSTDFKGVLPTFLINQLLARLILNDAEMNRKQVEKLARKEHEKAGNDTLQQ